MKYINNYSSIILIILFSFLLFSKPLTANEQTIKKYENFSLYDYNQKLHSLKEFGNKNGIVIIFIATQCPVSNAYNRRMAKLFEKYGNDFSIIGINSNKQESVNEIKDHAEKNMLQFTILKDSNNVIADRFNASFTPEIFVLNNNFEQLYHGRIDDSRRENKVKVHDLENVLNEILAGKEVSVKETKAFGCSIKRITK